jgi:acyl-CoA thioesterase-2
MSRVLDELVTLLALERTGDDTFRGPSQDLGWGTVFGGQVVGQALSAAAKTVPPERHVHSLHAYFLLPGDASKPIDYEVDRIRDGGSFTTRRVIAKQDGKVIFNMAASFHIHEKGFEHQDEMPHAPPPETLPTEQERMAAHIERLPEFARERALAERPFESRPVVFDDPFHPEKKAARRMMWLKAQAKLPDDPALHAYLLAYASDFAFVTTSLRPHGVTWLTPGMQIASLDHVMWFHRPLRVDEWLLYDIESPSAHGARGLVRGRIFTRRGTLVATTAQEGLIRMRG